MPAATSRRTQLMAVSGRERMVVMRNRSSPASVPYTWPPHFLTIRPPCKFSAGASTYPVAMTTPISLPAILPGRVRSRDCYHVRLATSPSEVELAQQLRFEVFNLELQEGLAASYAINR